MHYIRKLILGILLSFSAFAEVIIENTCPDDPTFNGKCSLVDEPEVWKCPDSNCNNPDQIGYCYIKGYQTGTYIYGLYDVVLNRTPDTEGFLYWLDTFGGKIDRNAVETFINSAINSPFENPICGETQLELRNNIKKKQIIVDYIYYLGRCPTPSEMTQWLNDPAYSLDKLALSPTATEECNRRLCPSPPIVKGNPEGFTYDKKAETWISRDLNVCNRYSNYNSVILVKNKCAVVKEQAVCEDWWKKVYSYECAGEDTSFLNPFLGQSYCRVITRCKTWEDVSLNGGRVSCRVYLDKNRPNCDADPNKPECVADDCGDLGKRCTLVEYVSYGDLPDKANGTVDIYCDPISGVCGYKSVSTPSGVNLGVYVYECPNDVRKICREYENTVKCPAVCPDGTKVNCPDDSNQAVCPDGSFATCPEQACNTVKTCLEYETTTSNTYEIKTCSAKRNYTEYVVYKNSQQEEELKARPECIAISSQIEYEDVIGKFAWGWDGDCGDDCGTCESYITGLKIINSKGTDLGVWRECLYVSGSSRIFPSSSQLRAFFTRYLTEYLGVSGSVVNIGNVSISSGYSGTRPCYGADCYPSRFREVPMTIAVEKATYRCYSDTVDTSNCQNLIDNCELMDNLSDLSELTCENTAVDIYNSTKGYCQQFSIQFNCPTTATNRKCIKWETQQVCNDAIFPIKDVEIESKDFTEDFAKATALAQLANEMKHIWSGKWMKCDNGWFSSVFQNPMEFFKQRLISFAVSQFGAQFLSAVETFVSDYLGQCASPTYSNGTYAIETDAGAIAGVSDSIAGCLAQGASQAWTDADSSLKMQEFLTEIGFDPNNPALSFITSPLGQFALQTAIAIVMSTEKCNACNNKECATKHGFYDTYGLIKGGNCIPVQSGCAWKVKYGVGSVCLRKSYYYCCYDSVFARILVKEAYNQLGYSFRDGNCSAITWEDLQRLDFDAMDWTELQQYLETKMKGEIEPELIKEKINNFFEGGSYGNQQWTGEVPYQN
ncbi:MAG: hypothetical protein DSY47_02685 [Hydrogenothermus sp.]|nr:MAG: hypothetical protein DSY47_02685 [Hydrogenothermus sp.]